MVITTVCWVNGNGSPDMEAFKDKQAASKFVEHIMGMCGAVVIKNINVEPENPEETKDE